jgi:hypothetical protein
MTNEKILKGNVGNKKVWKENNKKEENKNRLKEVGHYQ